MDDEIERRGRETLASMVKKPLEKMNIRERKRGFRFAAKLGKIRDLKQQKEIQRLRLKHLSS